MNYRLLFTVAALLCMEVSASAQWFQVRWWLQEPATHEFRVSGIPTNWPSSAFKTNAPVVISGWQLMTEADYFSLRQSLKPAYDAWHASLTTTQVQTRNAKLQAVADIFDRLELAKDNWNTLTTAQITQVVSNQNLLWLQLRPLLREIYESKE